MKTIIEKLNRRMPELLNIEDTEYQKIFGKLQFTPILPITESADYSCGAVANELEFVRDFISELADSYIPDNAEGDLLERITDFFVGLERIWDETDSALLTRFYSYLRRSGNSRWETAWAMMDMFRHFFPTLSMFVEPSYVETDLLVDGDFEDGVGTSFSADWSAAVAGSTTVLRGTVPYSGACAAEFSIDSSNTTGSLTQTIGSVIAGNFKLCFFYKDDGACPGTTLMQVTITRDSDGFYYNAAAEAWQAGAVTSTFDTVGDAWTYGYVYIVNEDTDDLTFEFSNVGDSGQAYIFELDRVMFGVWQDYASFLLHIIFEGIIAGDVTLALAAPYNIITGGDCEQITSPTLDGSSYGLTGGTWARSSGRKYQGQYSWLLTKTIAAGTACSVSLVDNNTTTDMHRLLAGSTHNISVTAYTNAATASNVALIVRCYYGGTWNEIVIPLTTSRNWVHVSLDFEIPPQTTGFDLMLRIAAAEIATTTVNLDTVRLHVTATNRFLYGKCEYTLPPTLDSGYADLTNGEWTRNATTPHAGDYSWQLTKDSAGGGGDASIALASDIAVDNLHGLLPGGSYKLEMYGYSDAAAPSSVKVYLQEYYSASWHATELATLATTSAWELLVADVAINAATEGAYIQLFIDSAEVITTLLRVDNIRLISQPAKNNHVEYGEEPTTNSPSIDNSYSGDTNGTWTQETAGWTLTKSTAAGAGEASVVLADNADTTDMHGLDAGDTYKLSVEMLTDAAIPASVKLSLFQYYGAAWHETALVATVSGSAVTVDDVIILDGSCTGVYLAVAIDTDEVVSTVVSIKYLVLTIDLTGYAAGYFFDQSYIAGAGGGYTSDFYNDLLDKARPSGVKGDLTYILRE